MWPGAFKEEYFSQGAKSFFLIFFLKVECFFPVGNSHFGRPKTNFSGFKKWKAQNKINKQTKKSTYMYPFWILTPAAPLPPVTPLYVAMVEQKSTFVMSCTEKYLI